MLCTRRARLLWLDVVTGRGRAMVRPFVLVRLCRRNRELRGQSNVLRAATFVALSYMGRLIIIIERGRDIMRELAGRTAFVTGAASGIGLALGRAFAEAGMNVMLADIEIDALQAAVKSLDNLDRVRGVTCDVADPGSVEHAAKTSYAAFGNVHVLCNNAGVGARGGI